MLAKITRTKGEDFGNLWTKLEEGKRKVIGGLDRHSQMEGYDLANN